MGIQNLFPMHLAKELKCKMKAQLTIASMMKRH